MPGGAKAQYLGRIQLRFSDEGFLVRDQNSEARYKWANYIGYLEDGQVLLLYAAPTRFMVIPQRALIANGLEFKAMVEARLSKYNYRNPVPFRDSEPLVTSQPTA